MKNISKITDKEINIFSDKKYLGVYEILDMIYFKMRISKGIRLVINSKGKIIGDIDIIVNSIYKDIMDFCNSFDFNSLYNKYGQITIGFFYLPVHKTKHIVYNNIPENTFILSDYYVENKNFRGKINFDEFVGDKFNFISGWNDNIGPYIGKVKLGEWFDKNSDHQKLIYKIFDNMNSASPVSGNDISDIEGIILKSDQKSYKLLMNDSKPKIEVESKLIYRDTLLESFIHSVPDDKRNAILDSDKDYKDKIYDLFLEYIDNTDFFNTMWFDDDDLIPPIDGYIGDLSYDMVPPIVAIVCRKNPIYKNVLRILLVTFSNAGNNFDRFKDKDKHILYDIISRSSQLEYK